MGVLVLSGCGAAATWEQRAVCSPAIGKAGSCKPHGSRFADDSHHGRRGSLPTHYMGSCVCRGCFSTHFLWACGVNAKRKPKQRQIISSAHPFPENTQIGPHFSVI